MQISAFIPSFTDATDATDSTYSAAASQASAGAAAAAAGTRKPATPAPAAASTVTLSAEGRQLAAATTSQDAPPPDDITQLERTVAAIPDPVPLQTRVKTAQQRKKEKESSLVMLDVDGFRNLREKLKAKIEQRAEKPPLQQQQQDDAKS
ncbi:MAG: hypothetical protein GAK35_00169 [Herbaspirillum frisingense]|uniref:Uncharacterized protein n=1 Tax=Herbaspirillum frisingense TaxID=92645 RepID=A0A7V8G0B3_9BURK|nr:MAG: hypothetical protein GAK35_00169 [Herbaspirillum frisingense]